MSGEMISGYYRGENVKWLELGKCALIRNYAPELFDNNHRIRPEIPFVITEPRFKYLNPPDVKDYDFKAIKVKGTTVYTNPALRAFYIPISTRTVYETEENVIAVATGITTTYMIIEIIRFVQNNGYYESETTEITLSFDVDSQDYSDFNISRTTRRNAQLHRGRRAPNVTDEDITVYVAPTIYNDIADNESGINYTKSTALIYYPKGENFSYAIVKYKNDKFDDIVRQILTKK